MLFISSPQATAYGMTINGRRICKFKRMQKDKTGSAYGTFNTDDAEIIDIMQKHSDFGLMYYQVGKNQMIPEKPFIEGTFKVDKGVISWAKFKTSAPVDQSKAIRFGELRGQLFKKSGEMRADAEESLIEEFNTLKEELGQ